MIFDYIEEFKNFCRTHLKDYDITEEIEEYEIITMYRYRADDPRRDFYIILKDNMDGTNELRIDKNVFKFDGSYTDAKTLNEAYKEVIRLARLKA